jgi:probable rRNA maturation factor
MAGPLGIQVEVQDAQAHLWVDAELLVGLARRTLEHQSIVAAVISIALVDDSTIHALNRRHLSHDWPTDVITFRLSDRDESELSAELVLSAEMATRTARDAGVDPVAELALYLVHGLLHLCGYDDKTPEDALRMRAREAEVMAREGLDYTFAKVASAAVGVDSESSTCRPRQ